MNLQASQVAFGGKIITPFCFQFDGYYNGRPTVKYTCHVSIYAWAQGGPTLSINDSKVDGWFYSDGYPQAPEVCFGDGGIGQSFSELLSYLELHTFGLNLAEQINAAAIDAYVKAGRQLAS